MTFSLLIALGSNLGDRNYHLHAALTRLRSAITLTRISSIIETDPVDAPAGSSRFLNMVAAGHTSLSPFATLDRLHQIEASLGRRRGLRNAPRIIDLDLILHSAHLVRSASLMLPHPRYREREFVMRPLRELGLTWRDPATGAEIR